jgi:predicted nuclease of predicted toxin-antitoxin system
VKLLIDENLSPRLAAMLGDLFPGTRHVEGCELNSASDEDVWQYAGRHGFAIVSKDSDFSELSALRGSPPKVIWLRAGNCTTNHAELALRESQQDISRFLASKKETCLVISIAAKMPAKRAKE